MPSGEAECLECELRRLRVGARAAAYRSPVEMHPPRWAVALS